MPSISIQLPAIEADQSIEIEVKINNKKKRTHYRVEFFPWEECLPPVNRVECLKEIIKNYDQNWQLMQIGNPTDNDISLMFKQVAN